MDRRDTQALDLGWVTCRRLPEPDHDEELALAALAAAGLRVGTLAWDDPDAPAPREFRICVLRSCWNYFEHPERFEAWLEDVAGASSLLNGLGAARWNLHKRYLAELAEAGVPVVPTVFVGRGADFSVARCLERQAWDAVVIKPAISAGSFATRRFSRGETRAAQGFLESHIDVRDMMVQRFVPSVESGGERCFVWIDGELTHAVDKRPRFADEDESVSEALVVRAEEAELCQRVLATAARVGGFSVDDLLYARIDAVELDGERVLSELELLEPSLFLKQSPAALRHFVEAVGRRLRGGGAAGPDGAPRPTGEA